MSEEQRNQLYCEMQDVCQKYDVLLLDAIVMGKDGTTFSLLTAAQTEETKH